MPFVSNRREVCLEMYEYLADDLDQEELIYELSLRGETVTQNTSTDVMKRSLRNWLKQDRLRLPFYVTTRTIEDEYEIIKEKLIEIKVLLTMRNNSKQRSRLIHLKN